MNLDKLSSDSFDALVQSRKAWLEETLRPWCQSATLTDLRRAEREWPDFAGRATPQQTLWKWAWERFPDLIHEGLQGLEETYAVEVIMQDGSTFNGFPDSRLSQNGRLVLIPCPDAGQQAEMGPLNIDQIACLRRIPESA